MMILNLFLSIILCSFYLYHLLIHESFRIVLISQTYPKIIIFRSICLLIFTLPDPEYVDSFWIILVDNECQNELFTNDVLTSLSEKVIKPEDIPSELITTIKEESNLQYKIIKTTEWKDSRIFSIYKTNISGPWDAWLQEIKTK